MADRPNAAEAVLDVVERQLGGQTRREPGGLEFRIGARHGFAAACPTGEWLDFRVPTSAMRRGLSSRSIRTMLRRNAGIDGNVRITGNVTADESSRCEIAAEWPLDCLPLHHDAELERCIADSMAALESVLTGVSTRRRETAPAAPDAALLESFDGAGWPAQCTENGALEVVLDVPGNYIAASVRQLDASLELSVPLVTDARGKTSEPARQALALLVWLVASRFRLVRPTLTGRSVGFAAGLPYRLPGAALIGHVCAALSAALAECAAEARLLVADERLAAIYLRSAGIRQDAQVQARLQVHSTTKETTS
jgi:hypothetical protein